MLAFGKSRSESATSAEGRELSLEHCSEIWKTFNITAACVKFVRLVYYAHWSRSEKLEYNKELNILALMYGRFFSSLPQMTESDRLAIFMAYNWIGIIPSILSA
jgi:hypothetical protein